MKTFDVITVGAAVRDVYIQSDAFRVAPSHITTGQKDACFVLGSKIEVEAPLFETGGGATNAAATFAHLGFKTAVLCRVGSDQLAQNVRDDLHAHGIYTDLVTEDAHHATGYSLLLTAQGGERTAIVYRGASSAWVTRDIPATFRAQWVYVTSLGGNIAIVKTVLERAHASGCRIAWNPGTLELAHGFSKLKPLLRHADIVLLNRQEAAMLTRESHHDTEGLLRSMASHVKDVFVMTDGTHGAHARQADVRFRAFPNDVTIVNTTGAGDAFGSGFVSGFASFAGNVTDALRLATLNAESVIQKIGAKNGLLERMPGTRRLGSVRVESYT